MHACLKMNNIVLPPPSVEYVAEDLEPFFENLVKHHGKKEEEFKFIKDCVKKVGKIPF